MGVERQEKKNTPRCATRNVLFKEEKWGKRTGWLYWVVDSTNDGEWEHVVSGGTLGLRKAGILSNAVVQQRILQGGVGEVQTLREWEMQKGNALTRSGRKASTKNETAMGRAQERTGC